MVWASLLDPLVSTWWVMRGGIGEPAFSGGLIVLVFGLPEIVEAVVLLRGGRRLGSFVRQRLADSA